MTRTRRSVLPYLLVLAVFGSTGSTLGGCGDDAPTDMMDTDAGEPPDGVDTDEDGLSDAEEATYGTSPALADSDGDGFTDGEEVNVYGFNPSANYYRYNPLIADLPKLQAEIVTVPSIILNYTETTGTSETITNSMGGSNSTSTEKSYTGGFSVGLEAGTEGGKPLFKVNAETQHNWTNGSITDNTTTHENSEAFEESNEIASSGGEISVGVVFRNIGYVPFTIESATFSAVNFQRDGSFSPVGNLEFDTRNTSAFPVTSLEPGGSTGTVIYANPDLNLGTAKAILADSSSLGIELTQSELVGADDEPLIYDRALSQTRTASIQVDYGPAVPPENHLVAVNVDPAQPGRSLAGLLEMLAIPVTEGVTEWNHPDGSVTTYTGLTMVRELANNPSLYGRWVVTHTVDDGLDTTTTLYDAAKADYSLDAIDVQASDIVTLVFLEDADVDSLGVRQEALLGTDPTLADTDLDGLDDYEETQGDGWLVPYGNGGSPYPVASHPLVADIDEDGWLDGEEKANLTDPYKADTDGDGTIDSEDDDPLFDPSDPRAAQPKVGVLTDVLQLGSEIVIAGQVQANTVGGQVSTIEIDWGDGSEPVTLTPARQTYSFSTSSPVSHSYTTDGAYVVTISAEDDQDPVNSTTKSYDVVWSSPFDQTEGFGTSTGWLQGVHLRTLGDVDGDGDDDLIGFGVAGVYVALSNGDSFGPVTLWSDHTAFHYASNYGTRLGVDPRIEWRRVADVDGDGRVDIVVFTNSGVYVGLSDGTGFDVAPRNTTSNLADYLEGHELADLDGDGDLDWVWFTQMGVETFEWTGTDFITGTSLNHFLAANDWGPWFGTRQVADMNGDGVPDLVGVAKDGIIHVAWGFLDGTTYQLDGAVDTSEQIPDPVHTRTDGGVNYRYRYKFADVNNDGLTDFVQFGYAGVYTCLNSTTSGGPFSLEPPTNVGAFTYGAGGWQYLSTTTNADGSLHYRYNLNPRTLVDINGDGFVDIVGFANNNVAVSLNSATRGKFDTAIVEWTDMITALAPENTHTAMGQRSGAYPYLGTQPTTHVWHSYRHTADVNGDGAVDLVAFNDDRTLVLPGVSVQPRIP